MCSDCEAKRREDRAKYLEERGTRALKKKSDKLPTKKILLDRLQAARTDLLAAIERREQYGRESWWASGLDWYRKRYAVALENCLKAGIEVKA